LEELADVLLIAGFVTLGIGLYMYAPWVAYCVLGSLLMIGGILIGRPE